MDMNSLVSEFKNSRSSESQKLESAELTYSIWAAQQSCSAASLKTACKPAAKTLASEVAAIRQDISKSLQDTQKSVHAPESSKDLASRVCHLEGENKHMKSEIKDLKHFVHLLQSEMQNLRLTNGSGGDAKACPKGDEKKACAAKPKVAEDDIDLFGSDEEEDEESAKIREERLKAYADKKSKKPGPIAKSSVVLDVKPWDDETDMAVLEKSVRSVVKDGLLWGASKLVPVGYGIKKLQIMCVVEDDKVSIEELQEQIEAFEDFVQSVDIASFNKI